ncbi:MAG: hypothetical protein U1F26_12290 [Lysobacterales bacterium]
MTISRIRIALALAAGLLLTACATRPPQQSFNREAHADIHRIEVLTMPQANVRLHVANHPGYSFGLIGTLITEANREGKEDWLQETVRKVGFNQFETLRATLDAEMREKGYELIWPDPLTDSDKRIKRDDWALRKAYRPGQADALLDIGFMYVGYAAAGSGKGEPYRPTVQMAVRLLAADGKTVLFTDQIRYHNVLADAQAIIIEPDPTYAYPKFDDLKATGESSIEGLRIAVEETARTLAKQF